MQIRDGGGDPTPAGLATGGAIVVVVATGGAAAATNSSNWIAPIIALVGAVFVAVLTAITTNRRQAKQLAAEEQRQGRELSHQRDLTELAHLREFFDEAAAAFEGRLDAISEWATFISKSPAPPLPEEEPEGFKEATQPVVESTNRIGIVWRRMGLRLPVDHEVSQAYFGALKSLEGHADELNSMFEQGGYTLNKHLVLLAADMAAWMLFVDAARSELDRRAAATA